MTKTQSWPVDRISPTKRPAEAPVGFQRWRSLLFLHWEVPVEALRRLVPAGLSLDLYEGHAYVGVVPFAMQGVRPWWSPERLAFSFLETNVRTYVHHRGRPGVYFFSLDANSPIAVATARRFWGLPYFNARISLTRSGEAVSYSTHRSGCDANFEARLRIGQHLGRSQPGSLEHFFLERYLLFVERGGGLQVGQVHHSPYPVQAPVVESLTDTLVSACGLPGPTSPPDFAHYAEGVDVEIFRLRRLAD